MADSPVSPSTRLHTEFGEHFGVEVIERVLTSSCNHFPSRAAVPHLVPPRAER